MGAPPSLEPHSRPNPLLRHFSVLFLQNKPTPATHRHSCSLPGTSKGPDTVFLQWPFPAYVASAPGLGCVCHFLVLKKKKSETWILLLCPWVTSTPNRNTIGDSLCSRPSPGASLKALGVMSSHWPETPVDSGLIQVSPHPALGLSQPKPHSQHLWENIWGQCCHGNHDTSGCYSLCPGCRMIWPGTKNQKHLASWEEQQTGLASGRREVTIRQSDPDKLPVLADTPQVTHTPV